MAADPPDLIVIGERVALGPLRRDLAATYARWVNHRDVRDGLQHLGILTRETEEQWVDEAIAKGAERPPAAVNFTVYDRSDDAPVGTVGLFRINYVHSNAELGIAIGDRRGRGLGTEATRLTVAVGVPDARAAQRDARGARLERGRAARLRAGGLPPDRDPPRRAR